MGAVTRHEALRNWSRELPDAAVRPCPPRKGWQEPVGRTPLLPRKFADPLVRQVENFAVVEAVDILARTGKTEAPAA